MFSCDISETILPRVKSGDVISVVTSVVMETTNVKDQFAVKHAPTYGGTLIYANLGLLEIMS